MKTKAILQKIMYLIIFAGIMTANVSSILFGVDVSNPVFMAGILIAVIGVTGELYVAHPSLCRYRLSNVSTSTGFEK